MLVRWLQVFFPIDVRSCNSHAQLIMSIELLGIGGDSNFGPRDLSSGIETIAATLRHSTASPENQVSIIGSCSR
jgi:hypothetical protein